jgi:hypothetical protein
MTGCGVFNRTCFGRFSPAATPRFRCRSTRNAYERVAAGGPPAIAPRAVRSRHCRVSGPPRFRLPAEVHTLALSILRERVFHNGPSLAAEKLRGRHGCSVSRKT